MGAPIRVQIKFFAVLREQAGVSLLEYTTEARTPAELYLELQTGRGLQLPVSLLRAAVNGRYTAMDVPLQAGDQVVFIPPVAGG